MRAIILNCRRFADDRRGNIAMIFAFSVLLLFGIIGLAIDTARVYAMSSTISRSLDAASLAGAKLMNETTADDAAIIATASGAFNANTSELVAQGATLTGLSVVPNRSQSEVAVTVNAQMPTLFAGLLGLANFNFAKGSAAVFKVPQMEVVLALDVTGSMSNTPAGDPNTKLETMKSVAKSLIDSLFDEARTDSNIRIGLVPWSASVNPGSYAAAATGHAGYNGCVNERAGAGATTDDAPTATNLAAEFDTSHGSSGYVCPSEEITLLKGRHHRAALKSAVNDFTAGGMTAGHLGMAWGWYILSPNWSYLFPTNSQPKTYGSGAVKSVIMLTDGVFNASYLTGSPSSVTTYDDASYSQFQTICTNMRAQGIKVYTVGFDLTDARAVTELETCAGGSTQAFTASNASQLSSVFATIVKHLTSIRVAR